MGIGKQFVIADKWLLSASHATEKHTEISSDYLPLASAKNRMGSKVH